MGYLTQDQDGVSNTGTRLDIEQDEPLNPGKEMGQRGRNKLGRYEEGRIHDACERLAVEKQT